MMERPNKGGYHPAGSYEYRPTLNVGSGKAIKLIRCNRNGGSFIM